MGARLEEFKEDTIIINEGENKHRMYIVLEGEVILYSHFGTEDEYIVGAYGKGKTFGEFDLFSDGPNMYTAVAYTKVKTAWFEKDNLGSFIKGYPAYAEGLIESILKSFVTTAKELHMAIDELNTLKKVVSENEKAEEIKKLLDYTQFFDGVKENMTEIRYGDKKEDK